MSEPVVVVAAAVAGDAAPVDPEPPVVPKIDPKDLPKVRCLLVVIVWAPN